MLKYVEAIEDTGEKKYSVITVRVTKELHRAAKVKLAELDNTSFQELLLEFLERWVSGREMNGRTLVIQDAQKGDASRFHAMMNAPDSAAKRSVLLLLREFFA